MAGSYLVMHPGSVGRGGAAETLTRGRVRRVTAHVMVLPMLAVVVPPPSVTAVAAARPCYARTHRGVLFVAMILLMVVVVVDRVDGRE